VLNLPRADLPLHPETVWLFGEAEVDPAARVFRDELDLAGAYAEGRLRLVLVDHNRLCPSQSAWEPAVEEIVDHHADEGLYPRARRRIAPVGSCATLVAERLFAAAPDLVNRTVGLLLLGAILLDSVDLDPGAGRVTPRDREAAARLLSITGADRRALFERLQAGKFDVSALGTRDILRRDCKEFQEEGLRCAVRSAPLSLRDWARRDPGLEASFRAFARERGLGLLLVLCSHVRPEYRRELAVFSEDRSRREEVIGFLRGLGLGLSPLDLPVGEVAAFDQADLRASRKSILPPLQAHLRERRAQNSRPLW